MKSNLLLLSLLCLSSCKQDANPDPAQPEEKSVIIEIGDKALRTTSFPKRWNTTYFEGLEPMSAQDSTYEQDFQKLSDFFNSLKGSTIKDISKYKALLIDKKTESLDLLKLHKAYKYKDHRIEYIEVYKTDHAEGYDAPPQIRQLVVFRIDKHGITKCMTVCSESNYLFAAEVQIGYLDSSGKLTVKTFEVDETGVDYKGEQTNDYSKLF